MSDKNNCSRVGVCPKCDEKIEVGTVVGVKLGAALGALVGGGATDRWLGAAAGAVLGGVLGHYLDEVALPTCPSCRVALEIIDLTL